MLTEFFCGIDINQFQDKRSPSRNLSVSLFHGRPGMFPGERFVFTIRTLQQIFDFQGRALVMASIGHI
jgi:hypothetical protein